MVEKLNRTVADVTPDNLVNSAFKTDSFGVTVASGQGELKRGTVLALNSSGKAVILGTEEEIKSVATKCVANCILQKDVDATSADVVTIAYREGHFNKDALIVKSDYTLTADDIDVLRTHNIILSDEI